MGRILVLALEEKTVANKQLETHHSTIKIHDSTVIKTIESNYPFAIGEKEALIGSIINYRKLLAGLGIPVASEYEIGLEDGQVVERTKYCGHDGFHLLREGGHDEVIPMIVTSILPILRQSRMEVTIDPHPANWCFSDGKIYYVDFHPARYLTGNVYIVGFPQPTVERELGYSLGRYYNKTGIVRSLRFSAIRAGGRIVEEQLYGEISKYPEHIGKPILEQLDVLPERKFRNGGDIREVLKSLNVWNIDDVREIALVVADNLEADKALQFLNQILELTRGDFNRPLTERKKLMDQAKELITRTSI